MTAPVSKGAANREESALREPGNLGGFPTETTQADTILFRAVAFQRPKRREAWFFASFAKGEKPGGRFDLPEPKGTCYLATDIQTAVRERVGEVISIENLVAQSTVDGMEVAVLRLPQDVDLAHTGAERAADYGAIRELGAAGLKEMYVKTSKWAEAFADQGFDGVFYASRFTSGEKCTAVALFDNAGLQPWDEDSRVTGKDAFFAAKLGHLIMPIPHSISSSTKPVSPPPPLKRT